MQSESSTVLTLFIDNNDNDIKPIDATSSALKYGCNRALQHLEPLVNGIGLSSVLLVPVLGDEHAVASHDSDKGKTDDAQSSDTTSGSGAPEPRARRKKGANKDAQTDAKAASEQSRYISLDDSKNPLLRLIPEIRTKFPSLNIICDVCLCAFETHKSSSKNDKKRKPNGNTSSNITNTVTCQSLSALAIRYAQKGCSSIALSDMPDSRVASVRAKLDEAQFQNVAIRRYDVHQDVQEASCCFTEIARNASEPVSVVRVHGDHLHIGREGGAAWQPGGNDSPNPEEIAQLSVAPLMHTQPNITQPYRQPCAGFAFGADPLTGPRYAPTSQIGFVLPQNSPTIVSPMQFPAQNAAPYQRGESSESLYEGDTWSRVWFQRVMLLSLVRLIVFIRKVYEDYHATKTYRKLSDHTGHFLVAATTLLLPTFVFTVYRVTRYLQFALPSWRLQQLASQQQVPDSNSRRLATRAASGDLDDAQLRRALMATVSPSPTCAQSSPDLVGDEGLVTARGTPTPLDNEPSAPPDDDAPVQQPQQQHAPLAIANSPTAVCGVIDTPVNLNKLGNVPDKKTVGLVIGASEQLLHGVLFIFWQLKRQVDVLTYLVERSCVWRKPSEAEKQTLGKLRTGSDGLEWFQDFYAAFLAILAQVYSIGLQWSLANEDRLAGGGGSSGLNASLKTDYSQLISLASKSGEYNSPELDVSKAARELSNVLRAQAGADELNSKDLLIMSELLVSSAVIVSLLIAVRRRDDGPLTFALSSIGWGAIFASRIIVIAMAFVHIGWRLMLTLCAAHVVGIAVWIYKIAIDSHNDEPGESDEWRWHPDQQQPNGAGSVELESADAKANAQSELERQTKQTSQWTYLEHATLIMQIFTLFALPSLFYWPIMFNLKNHFRPFKYLLLIMSENFILIPAIWLTMSASATAGQWYLLGAVGAFSILGFVFISLYVSCKPTLTEYFARADELVNDAEKAGIYFEFCSRVFKMPDLQQHSFARLMNQTEQIETTFDVA